MPFMKIGCLSLFDDRSPMTNDEISDVNDNLLRPFRLYKEDIEILLSQNTAHHLVLVNARVNVNGDHKRIKIAVAAREDGTLIDGDNMFAALPCPRFNHPQGGIQIGCDLVVLEQSSSQARSLSVVENNLPYPG